jgi:hypothetical protein
VPGPTARELRLVLLQRCIGEEARRVVERHTQGAPSPDCTIENDSRSSLESFKLQVKPADMGWDMTFLSVENVDRTCLPDWS